MTQVESAKVLSKARREFTARYLGDISKAIFAVALASKLFVDLSKWLRIVLMLMVIVIFVAAFFTQPKGEKE